ncbi:hypothetical protein [Aurantimonas sp. VKM B-3413]|uniref:hypothetical protein n=1 Tax=Aurantimonas sp. VKM B-3413 TaxID=2779401 RepID=UPI001E55EFA0|nr:hypothetical protein [Aurantimonas sp. VKM B-3413]MCB8837306.1 hypothetical protein [Aurantimonas sp. VKM B-3413]
MRIRLALISLLSAFYGCVGGPSKCYVTLSPGGRPTAEACEKGPVLTVRPITGTNAAYYVPPYVLGALSYEGFVDPGGVTAQDGGTPRDDGQADRPDGEEHSSAEPAAGDMTGAGAIPASAALAGIGPHRMSRPDLPDLALSLAPSGHDAGATDPQAIWDAPLMAGPIIGPANSPPGAPDWRDPPANRIAPKQTIDGEVRYRRPYNGGYQSFDLSSDLLL